MIAIGDVLNKCKNVKRAGPEWVASCPAHEDRKPSLSVGKGHDGRVLLHCHAGCAPESIVNALGLSFKELMPEQSNGSRMNILETYSYTDEDGNLLSQVVRLHPKDFRQRKRDGRNGWTWGVNGVRRVPYRLADILAAELVLIAEGEKDVDNLRRHGFVATCNPCGAGKWRGEYAVYFKDKRVAILPDNDEPGKAHAKQVARSLVGTARKVAIVDLPVGDKQDVTDYLKNHTPDDLRTLIDDTLNSGTPGRLNAPRIAQDLNKRTEFLCTGSRLYRYDGGVFRKDGDRYIRQTLQRDLKDKYRKAFADEVVAYLEVANLLEFEELVFPVDLINLKNGVFDWQTGRLLEHSPGHNFLAQIPVNYDEAARCPNINAFLETTLNRCDIAVFDELLGYLLISDTRFQKAFMFVGGGANGKGTAINLLEQFIGVENVSKIPLQELDEHKFKRAELFGRLANVFADLDRRALKGTSYFKTIVAGDAIDAERKFKNAFFFRPYAKLIFSTNEIPHSPDNTDAFYRRWCIIPFENKFEGKNEDVGILQKLTTPDELSGLLNRALQGLLRLVDNNGFTETESTASAKDEYRKGSDSAWAFLSENIVQDADAWVKKTDLYGKYKNWCDGSGLRPLSPTKLNRKVKDVFGGSEWRKDGKVRCWRGIGLVDDFDQELTGFDGF